MSFCLTCHTAVPSAVELADSISPQLEKGVLCVNQGRIKVNSFRMGFWSFRCPFNTKLEAKYRIEVNLQIFPYSRGGNDSI